MDIVIYDMHMAMLLVIMYRINRLIILLQKFLHKLFPDGKGCSRAGFPLFKGNDDVIALPSQFFSKIFLSISHLLISTDGIRQTVYTSHKGIVLRLFRIGDIDEGMT